MLILMQMARVCLVMTTLGKISSVGRPTQFHLEHMYHDNVNVVATLMLDFLTGMLGKSMDCSVLLLPVAHTARGHTDNG